MQHSFFNEIKTCPNSSSLWLHRHCPRKFNKYVKRTAKMRHIRNWTKLYPTNCYYSLDDVHCAMCMRVRVCTICNLQNLQTYFRGWCHNIPLDHVIPGLYCSFYLFSDFIITILDDVAMFIVAYYWMKISILVEVCGWIARSFRCAQWMNFHEIALLKYREWWRLPNVIDTIHTITASISSLLEAVISSECICCHGNIAERIQQTDQKMFLACCMYFQPKIVLSACSNEWYFGCFFCYFVQCGRIKKT